MKHYDSLKDAYDDLKSRGYNRYFDMKHSNIYCGLLGLHLAPDEFNVDEIHRFEEDLDPDDISMLYVISSIDGSIKGTLMDPFGVHAEYLTVAMATKLQLLVTI
jgi:hypothetical protein